MTDGTNHTYPCNLSSSTLCDSPLTSYICGLAGLLKNGSWRDCVAFGQGFFNRGNVLDCLLSHAKALTFKKNGSVNLRT